MKANLNRDGLRHLVLSTGFLDAYAGSDPHANGFSSQFRRLADEAGRLLWNELRAVFQDQSDSTVARNAWALAHPDPLLTAAVWRAIRLAPEVDEALMGNFRQFWSTFLADSVLPDWLAPVADPAFDSIPDLSRAAIFSPALRLRYRLAWATREGIDAARVFSCIRVERKCSRLACQREVRKALLAPEKVGRDVSRLRERDFAALPIWDRLVVASDEYLFTRLVDPGDQVRAHLLAGIERGWSSRKLVRKKLIELRKAMSGGNANAFKNFARTPEARSLDVDLSAEFGSDLVRAYFLRRDRVDTWKPLSADELKFLRQLDIKKRRPRYLTLDAVEIASHLASGKLKGGALLPDDLRRLQKAWSDETRNELALSGRFDVLDRLRASTALAVFPKIAKAADSDKPSIARDCLESLVRESLCLDEAIPLLGEGRYPQLRLYVKDAIERGNRKWFGALSPLFGTRAAEGIFAGSNASTTRKLLKGLVSGSGILDRHGYVKALGVLICSGLQQSWDEELGRWLRVSTGFVKSIEGAQTLLTDSLRHELVIELLKYPSVGRDLRRVFESTLADREDVERINIFRLQNSTSGSQIYSMCRADKTLVPSLPLDRPDRIKWSASRDSAAAHVLMLRRSPRQLKSLAIELGSVVFESAAFKAAALLPERSRDRGFLELSAKLGHRNICVLAAVMASMHRGAQAGHKLNKSYHQYELPKKSGGTRTVSVPDPIAKKIQRAILAGILDPLGAHPASHGFVRKRSIGTNASLHVNRSVVANCDIASCFPSVKWSLVLGVLRRDLGNSFCPAAISLLVDICTARGALPIGAPTSPALLNRVLLKSDAVLAAAASKRRCRYTRYADDLTFSGDDRAVEMLGIARRILAQIGLSIDPKKTNIFRRGRRQIVTGLVVNDRVSVPRRLRRRMRAAVHAVEQGKSPKWHDKDESPAALRGRISFLRSINQEEGERLLSRLRAVSGKKDA